ncbi:MAG: type II secretion system inner membrane protein GspF [Pseudomonadales bacterium]|nr:type II secretion system inner membrane protein GspF [Pseudomonadales bacterium]
MPAFEYVVLDTSGKQKKGVLEGDSPRQVRQQLKEKGFVPLSVDMTSEKQKEKGKSFFQSTSISAGDLALITRQIATLLQAGLPVEEALKGVAKQTEKPRITSMILAVRSKVVEGHTLASALTEYPAAFPDLYRATVDAGERSGHLGLVMEQLSDYTESRYQTTKKIQGAMIYPVVLVLFSIAIVVGMLTFVVPKIVSIIESSGQELPTLTKIMIGGSEFLQSWWWLCLLVIVALAWGWRRLMRIESNRYRFHKFLMKLPLIGKMNRGFNAARVVSTLAILSKSGVPLVEALRIAGEVAGNLVIKEAVGDAAVKLREGASLFVSLDQTGYFPPMMMQMIASGERSGELDDMLQRAANNQERDLEDLISTIVSLFEPIMLVVMGGVVLLIVLSIMMPVISMNASIG